MIASQAMTTVVQGDSALVAACLSGNRDAFGEIVERYQSLVCSIAYSATGNLSQSEDLAQETFVTAWRQLGGLRDPARLRSWLCGIARNLINNWLRRRGREPSHAAETLDTVHEVAATQPLPTDHTINREEEALLWRSLEQIPATYREPLVLFYREHHSIQRVAMALELSEDAVKQRLSRGRRLLHEQVLAFVEGALERTSPGKAFTLGVLVALPVLIPQSAAAGVAVTAAKGSTLAKSAATVGIVGSLLGPLIGFLGGAFGAWMSIKHTKSPRERRFMIRCTWIAVGLAALALAAMWSLIYFGRALYPERRGVFVGLIVGYAVLYFITLLGLILWGNRRQRQIQVEDGTYVDPAVLAAQVRPPTRAAVLGGLGGSIIGGTAWLTVSALRVHDWFGAGVIVFAAMALFMAGARVCLRRPERYVSVIVWVCVALGVLTLALINWRWSAWFEGKLELKNWTKLTLSAGVTLLYGVIALAFLSRRRVRVRQCASGGSKRNPRL